MKNKKILFYNIFLILIVISLAIPFVYAVSIGGNTNPQITTEDFSPLVWMCDSRVVYDDNTEPGRVSPGGDELIERINNYAFEGEQISWDVLVMDKNKIDQNIDVYAAVGDSRGGNRRPVLMKVNHTVSYCDSTGTRFVPWSQDLVIPKFDTNLGQLVKVIVNGSEFIEINATFENVDPFTGANFSIIYNGGNISVTFPEKNLAIINSGFIESGSVGPYDNLTDFDGVSGESFYFINTTQTDFPGINLNLYESAFPGENLMIPASSSGDAVISGLANFDGGVRTMSGADVCVIYTYQTEEAVSPGGTGIEANCQRIGCTNTTDITSCNARIGEERFTSCDSGIMDMFRCILTVETPESMYGEHWISVIAVDGDGNTGMMDENEYWFLNPVIALSIDGDMTFEEVRPGTDAYSSTMLVGNDADYSSGVLMDMFISGTDFYDSASSGARCPDTNQLSLSNFRYFATNGAYSTQNDLRKDPEGYVGIEYGIGFNDPNPFYDNNEMIQAQEIHPYYTANLLAPGAEMVVTFKLSLPEPCNGNFDTGSIYFWGEAI